MILVTGGAGYIGSHCCVELLDAGYDVVVLDNFSNSSKDSIRRVEQLTGHSVLLEEVDLLDAEETTRVMSAHPFEAVVHFAGLKAVGESVQDPLRYYHNNVTGTLNLLRAMGEVGTKKLVFSSSATVYGEPEHLPIHENCRTGATNPYGRSKLLIEQMLFDLAASHESWGFILLRYFNPVGAHESGLIGEDPGGVPNNLLPYVMEVANGVRPHVRVFGDDYPTRDGTGVRDYIHVVDLAKGHLAALQRLEQRSGVSVYNLGTGTGFSVLEILDAAREATGQAIPHVIQARRPGDVAECYADPSLAERELGWRAERSLRTMVEDAWRWEQERRKE